MEQLATNQRIIIILSAVLLALVVVGGVVYYLLPDSTKIPTNEEQMVTNTFDLGVTQRAGYLRLNTRPIQEGALPVAPPAGVGKANPFL